MLKRNKDRINQAHLKRAEKTHRFTGRTCKHNQKSAMPGFNPATPEQPAAQPVIQISSICCLVSRRALEVPDLQSSGPLYDLVRQHLEGFFLQINSSIRPLALQEICKIHKRRDWMFLVTKIWSITENRFLIKIKKCVNFYPAGTLCADLKCFLKTEVVKPTNSPLI